MDLALSELQEILKSTARDFGQRDFTIARYRQFIDRGETVDHETFHKMANLQWTGLLVDEAFGGVGGGWVDLLVLLEEMGKALMPMTYMAHMLATLAIQEFGSEEQRRNLLPELVAGRLVAAVAVTEMSATYDESDVLCAVRQEQDTYVLSGVKSFVRGGMAADVYLILGRLAEGLALFLVERRASGVTVTALANIGDDDQTLVTLNDVSVPATSLIGMKAHPWTALRRIIDMGALIEAGYGVGVMARDTSMTIDYVKDRIQFARPIGTFQAVQHQVADQVTDVDCGRYLSLYAAWATDERKPEAGAAIARAKAWVSDALRRVVRTGNQLHGGIGFSREYDIHLYYQRAKTCELIFGFADLHREHVAAALLDS